MKHALGISYQAERTGPWKPLIELQPINDDLRLFLLFALGLFLRDNARKKSWKLTGTRTKRTVDVVLNSLIAPVWSLPYGNKGYETNLTKIHELMGMFRRGVTGERNPSVIAAARDAMDQEIDAAFFFLYGLSPSEVQLIRSSIIR